MRAEGQKALLSWSRFVMSMCLGSIYLQPAWPTVEIRVQVAQTNTLLWAPVALPVVHSAHPGLLPNNELFGESLALRPTPFLLFLPQSPRDFYAAFFFCDLLWIGCDARARLGHFAGEHYQPALSGGPGRLFNAHFGRL